MSGCRNRSRARSRVCLPLWDPRMLPSGYSACFDAQDLAALTITTGASVDSWKDFRRTGRDVTSVSTKPTLVGGALNGFPCVRFNASPMNSTATIPMGSTWSVICLMKDNSGAAAIQEPFSVGTSLSATSFEDVLDYDGTVGTNRLCYYNASIRAKTTVDYSDSPALMAMGLNGGVSDIRANGVTGTSVGSSISTTDAVFRVGGSRPQATYPLDGDMYNLTVIQFPIGSPEYLKAEGWVANRYKVQHLLGAGHPYRYRPPYQGD